MDTENKSSITKKVFMDPFNHNIDVICGSQTIEPYSIIGQTKEQNNSLREKER